MTRKQFLWAASILNRNAPPVEATIDESKRWMSTCRELAELFKSTNVRFDKAAFLKACGINVW